MSLRVVIVDDEAPARERLRGMLAEHPDVEIVGEAGDVDGAVALLESVRPDVVFLDVQMPGGDGFDVLRRSSWRTRVVFTTAYDAYAVRAFEVHSVDYLLKPYSRSRFAEALGRARDALAGATGPGADVLRLLEEIRSGLPAPAAATSGAPVRISARRGAKIVLLDPSDVAFFEADDTIVHARSGEGRYLVDKTLQELEAQLAPAFFRIHRGYLVNLSRIGEIVPGEAGTFRIVLKDDAKTQLPLSRRQAQRLREIIPW